jgi:hypothetical protein
MRHILALTAMLILNGCALPATVWTKPEVTQDQFAKDTYECEQDARAAGNTGEGITQGLTLKGFYERCMIGRGYIKKSDAPTFRAAGSSPGILSSQE